MRDTSQGCRRHCIVKQAKGRIVTILIFSLNMPSSARHKKTLTTDEVTEGVFGDRNSENGYKSEGEMETETEEESEKEESEEKRTGNEREESNNAKG